MPRGTAQAYLTTDAAILSTPPPLPSIEPGRAWHAAQSSGRAEFQDGFGRFGMEGGCTIVGDGSSGLLEVVRLASEKFPAETGP